MDTLDESNPNVKHLDLLGKVERFVLKPQQVTGSMTGFLFDIYVENEEPKSVVLKFLKYEANIARGRIYGRPEAAYGLVIQESENTFLLVVCGFQVTCNSVWKCAMMLSESPDYGGFPVAITIPENTKIARVTLYCIDKYKHYVVPGSLP